MNAAQDGHSAPPDRIGWDTRAANLLAAAMTLCAIVWNVELPSALGFAWLSEQFYALILGFNLGLVYLLYRANGIRRGPPPWYDWLLAAVSLGVIAYICLNYLRLRDHGYAYSTDEVILFGALLTLLVLEGLRRAVGYVLLVIVLIFLAYALLGHLVPGQFVGPRIEWWKLAANMGFNPNAIFGIPLEVATGIVIMFILFGQVLIHAGGGQFFTDIAMATMGKRRGGAAKISVVGSAMFGTVSGAAVSNVVSTGVITIPLMQRAGYRATHAGAIEAIASTGGQLMPPIMGAAAFLMAEFLDVPYAEVVIAAIIPSLLYYFAVFVQVDLIAGRENISVVDIEVPSALETLKEGWQFIIPFVVLIVALFEFNMAPEKAAAYSVLVLLAGGMLKPYKGRRIAISDWLPILIETGRTVISLILIVAAAGMVIGVLNLTGLAFQLTFFLGQFAGNNLWIVLGISALASIILGMGMPTAASYILLAGLIAPAIVNAGVPGMAAHLFVLYFGMMSMLTPPIALSAFAAATITKADPMMTGFVAMKLGWVAYVVPFLFVLSPTLIMQGDVASILVDVGTAAFGVYLISVSTIGFFVRRMGVVMRLAVLAAGIAALVPHAIWGLGGLVSAIGVAVGVGLLALEAMIHRRRAPPAAREAVSPDRAAS